MTSLVLAVEPLNRPPQAVVRVPGSKSHTNRALVCAALAGGTSTLHGALHAEDTQAMLENLGVLGIEVSQDSNGALIVVGSGGELPSGPLKLDANQSGTTSRFLLPMLALGAGPYHLDGHAQLRSRPIGSLIDALCELGVDVEGAALPLAVRGGQSRGGHLVVSGSTSSQFLSGLLLAAPLLADPDRGNSMIIELSDDLVSKPYIDLTVATMNSFGVDVGRHNGYRRFEIAPQNYRGADCQIEPDASAASYFFAAAAITGGSVRVEGLDASTIQGDLAFVDALEQMGAHVRRGSGWTEVRGPDRLRGVNLDMSNISDTAQTLAVVAACAESPSEITGIGFIRAKETDRIGAVVAELSRLGIRAVELEDGLKVWPGSPSAGVVDTYDDHRMAMSFALLGLLYEGISIDNPGCVRKTFPSYFQALDQLR